MQKKSKEMLDRATRELVETSFKLKKRNSPKGQSKNVTAKR